MGDVPVSKGIPAGGQFLDDTPLLTDRQHLTLQLDERGNLKVVVLTTDQSGNVIAVSNAPVGGLTAQVTKDPLTNEYLSKLVKLAEAQKDFNLNGTKPGIQKAVDGFQPLHGLTANGLNMILNPLTGQWNRSLSAVGAPGVTAVNNEGTKATYSCGILATTAAANATDIFTIRGSASKTIRVTRISISGEATANTLQNVQLLKYSVFLTGGTPVAGTAVPHDSRDVAATAAIATYTANPTVGTTLVGALRTFEISFSKPAAATITEGPLVLDFTLRGEKGIVLRGLNEYLSLNLGGVTAGGLIYDVDCSWTEEPIA
jgi:hypothetical protein